MIDQATGMKSGERYRVENVERAHQFPGFFQDGKYYLGPELLTAVGWLEGTRFIYDSLDAAGEPVFPNREAGTIEGLTLTLVDGTSLELSQIEASDTIAHLDPAASGAEREAPDRGATLKGPLGGKVVVITGASSGIGRPPRMPLRAKVLAWYSQHATKRRCSTSWMNAPIVVRMP
jgi:hypothetical protein